MDRRQVSPITNQPLSELEQEIFERLTPLFQQQQQRQIAQALAAGPDCELLGRKEFELRDAVHQLGAQALEAAAHVRQKKGWIRGC